MNEIKFACPHCHQHIACNEGYCSYQIRCPACGGGMIVPGLAAFGVGAATNLSLSLPVATLVPQHASHTLSDAPVLWSEKAWNRHVASIETGSASESRGGLILLLLFFTPALLALLFFNSVSGHGEARAQWLWTAWTVFTPICSLLCAAGLSQTMSKNVLVRIIITIVLAPFIWGLNSSISLFLGCVAGLMSTAAKG